MKQNISLYSPPKDIQKVTETQTYTDKPYSHFDPTHDQISSNKGNTKMPTFKDLIVHQERNITLTKVRSMPPSQFNKLDELDQAHAQGTLEIDSNKILEMTENKSNKELQNKQIPDLYPITNRSKLYELNQTYNRNLDSKELISQGISPIFTQEISQANLRNRNDFPKYINPITFEGQFQNQRQINIIPESQHKSVALPFIRVQNGQSYKIPNIRFTTNQGESQFIKNPYRNVKFANNPQLNKSSIIFKQPNLIGRDSREVRACNVTDVNTRMLYQNEIIDQRNEVEINKKSLAEKISHLKISELQKQEFQQIQIKRPLYHHAYYDKGQSYRTVGPQQDYYRQNQTNCSNILPILGMLFVVLLISGTFFGLGVMTGMFGGRNYLSQVQTRYSQIVKLTQQPQVKGFVTNEIENGEIKKPQGISIVNLPVLPPSIGDSSLTQVTPLKNSILTAKTLIPSTAQMTQLVKQPKIPIQLPSKIQKASESTVQLLRNNQSQEKKTQKSISELIKQLSSQINRTIQADKLKSETFQVKETQDTKITPQKTDLMKPQELQQNKTQADVTGIAQQPSTQQFKKSYNNLIEQMKIVKPITSPTHSPSQQPETQLIEKQFDETTVKSALIKIKANLGRAITKPQEPKVPVIPVSQLIQNEKVSPSQQVKPAVQPLIIKPKENKLPEFVSQQSKKPIETGSITSQQAQEIVSIILEENSEVVPQNFRASIKVDTLDEFQKVPLNFRDVHHIQTITYKHIQTLLESDHQHKSQFNLVNYRHHQIGEIRKE